MLPQELQHHGIVWRGTDAKRYKLSEFIVRLKQSLPVYFWTTLCTVAQPVFSVRIFVVSQANFCPPDLIGIDILGTE